MKASPSSLLFELFLLLCIFCLGEKPNSKMSCANVETLLGQIKMLSTSQVNDKVSTKDKLYVIGTEGSRDLLESASQVFRHDRSFVEFLICTDCWTDVGFALFLFEQDVERFRCLMSNDQRNGIRPRLLTTLQVPFESNLAPKRLHSPTKVLGSRAKRLVTLDHLIEQVNQLGRLYRNKDGSLNEKGSLLDRLQKETKNKALRDVQNKCEVIGIEEYEFQSFKDRFYFTSKPVIVKGGAKKWIQGAERLNEALLRSEPYGSSTVGLKVVPRAPDGFGYFECTEPLHRWVDPRAKDPPEFVLRSLSDTEKVLVRPAHTTMPLNRFLDSVRHPGNLSLYVEYFPLQGVLSNISNLAVGSSDSPPYEPLLPELKMENIWISGGNTVGCLHFDAFENFLFQLNGSKTFTLFDPHVNNSKLYEGHLREGFFSFHSDNMTVQRSHLSDTTSIVNSPVDQVVLGSLEELALYPDFVDTPNVTCHVEEGDALYVPAFWWHQVVSLAPSGLNLALNYWFAPLFDKVYPCASCPLRPSDALLSNFL